MHTCLAAVGQSFLQVSFTWSSVWGLELKNERSEEYHKKSGEGPRVHGYICSLFPAEVKEELPLLRLVIMAAACCVGVMIPSP